MEVVETLQQCEDHLFPALRLTVRERAMYYHLLRHTRLEGKPSGLFAVLPLANALGVSESSAREGIRSLHDRGCIEIEDRSRHGHILRVFLPEEIDGVIPQVEQAPAVDLEVIDFFTARRFLGALIARQDAHCFYCLRSIRSESCELDHVVARAHGTDNSYRNVVCSCHECNTTKQAQSAADFLRSLYRKGILSQAELEDRLLVLEQLQAGKLKPDAALVGAAI